MRARKARTTAQRQGKPHRHAVRMGMTMLLFGLGACTITTPKPTDPDALAEYNEANDKYEPLNRKMFDLNMVAYKYALRPVGKAWIWTVPHPVRNALGNLAQTMNEPVVFFNDVGEGKSRRAGDTFVRWCINMTAGVGGLVDVAKYAGYPHHDGNAGLTLATWGVPSGPYLFLPGMGPSSFRGAIGYGIDNGLQPLNYAPRGYGLLTFNWAYNIAGVINGVADSIDQLDQVQRDSLDPYAFIRSAYQQQQKAQVDAIRNDHRATVPDWYN